VAAAEAVRSDGSGAEVQTADAAAAVLRDGGAEVQTEAAVLRGGAAAGVPNDGRVRRVRDGVRSDRCYRSS